MKFNLPINNFGAGEWSPKMQSRVDAEQYPRSCKELTNMIVQMQGGAQYRGGTSREKFANNAATVQPALDALLTSNFEPTKDFKLIPHLNQQYGNVELMIYTGSNFRLSDGSTVAYGANTVTTGWTPSTTQYQQVGDLLFLVNSTGLFKPKVFYRDPAAVVAPFYTLRDIDRDHITNKPWQTIPWDSIVALDTGVTLTTPAVVTGSFTLLSSAAYFSPYMVGRYIRLCNGVNLDGVVRITAYTNTTNVTVTALQTVPTASFAYGSTANASSFWQISDWGDTAVGVNNMPGWPKTVTAFQGRVIFGGTKTKPDTIWGSRIGNIFNMEEVPAPNSTGVYGFASSAFLSDNSRPFTLTPNSSQSSSIVALSSSKTLNIHTDTLEIVAYGSNSGALGPGNVVFESSTSFGASAVQPVRINSFSTFVQGNGYKVRDIVYNYTEDQYKSQDLSFLAEHMFVRTSYADIDPVGFTAAADKFPIDDIIELCRYEARSSILLVRTRAGKLMYLTLDRDYSVNAWGRITLGHEIGMDAVYPYEASPKVLAMCVSGKRILLLVKRQYPNSALFYVSKEYLNQSWEYNNNSKDFTNSNVPKPVYLDCAAYARPQGTPAGPVPTTTWQIDNYLGASLYGQNPTLAIIGDGNYLGDFYIGSPGVPNPELMFTTVLPYTSVLVGYRYKGVLTTAGIEQGGQYGTPVGRLKRVNNLVIRLFKTGSVKVGKDLVPDNLEEVVIRQPDVAMNLPTPYFTGDKPITFSQGYEGDYSISVVQDKPYPLYVVSVTANGVADD